MGEEAKILMRIARLALGGGLLLCLSCTFYVASRLHQVDASCGRCAHCAGKCCSSTGACGVSADHCTKLGSSDCRSATSKYPEPVIALPKIIDHLALDNQGGLDRNQQ